MPPAPASSSSVTTRSLARPAPTSAASAASRRTTAATASTVAARTAAAAAGRAAARASTTASTAAARPTRTSTAAARPTTTSAAAARAAATAARAAATAAKAPTAARTGAAGAAASASAPRNATAASTSTSVAKVSKAVMRATTAARIAYPTHLPKPAQPAAQQPRPASTQPSSLLRQTASHAPPPASHAPAQPHEAATAPSVPPSSTATSATELSAAADPGVEVSLRRVLSLTPALQRISPGFKSRQSLNGTVFYPCAWDKDVELDDTVFEDSLESFVEDGSPAPLDVEGRGGPEVDVFVRTGRWPVLCRPMSALTLTPRPGPADDAESLSEAARRLGFIAFLKSRLHIVQGLTDRYRAALEFELRGTIAGRRVAATPAWILDMQKEQVERK